MKNRGMKNVITFYKRLFEVHIFGIKYKQSPKEGGGEDSCDALKYLRILFKTGNAFSHRDYIITDNHIILPNTAA